MKAFTTLVTLVLAAAAASASPVPAPGTESAIEAHRAAGLSERDIAALLSVRHPCPSFHAHTSEVEERDVSPSMMSNVFQKRSMSAAEKTWIEKLMGRVLAGEPLGKRDVAEGDVVLVRPKTFWAKRAR
ncbi:hypothetical protein H2201_002862 [Coniosporium apollinis]|uniref:Uncharacterized protein n=1 Tax=Coniosporium apollinis TaxID=61459 RepID=A0ABQ9P2G0_9PEZI|nr:hypothetical protein H2201_002862 [Coniosporium apollinis]